MGKPLLNSDGYALIQTKRIDYLRWIDSKHRSPTVPIHIAAVEFCWLGFPCPTSYKIHHLDHNRTNWHLANLALLTTTQHMLNHAYGDSPVTDYYTRQELQMFSDENIARVRQCYEGKIRPLLPFDLFCKRVGFRPEGRK